MARIRSIKPEFWTSAQIIECSTNARLLFVGLWNFCDDQGRHPASPKQCKAEVFPSDDFNIETIQRMLDELSSNGLITFYVSDNIKYFYVNGWHHQKIDRPQKAKYPDPCIEDSSNDRRAFAPDRIGEDKKGEDKDAAPNGAHFSLEEKSPEAEDAQFYNRGKQLFGPKSGGLLKQLLTAKLNNVALARAALETASTKANPREYIGAIVRGRESFEDLRAKGEAW